MIASAELGTAIEIIDSASLSCWPSLIAMSFRIPMALLLLLGIGMCGGVARADTTYFSYSGSGSPSFDPGAVATGSGFFVTDDSNDPAGLGDLADFSFSLSLTYGGDTDIYNYGLADLVSFQATFADATLTDLTLTTDYQPPVYNWFEAFNVTGLGTDEAYTDDGDFDEPSIGTVTIDESSVPDPAALALVASGLLGLVAARRRGIVAC
jgi:hypothetical protein